MMQDLSATWETEQSGYRLHRWGADPVWERFPIVSPEPGEAVIEVEACGVGLTVLNWARGDVASDDDLLPRVPGHEIIGVVKSVGSPPDDDLLGKRVTVHAYLFCGRCSACVAGRESRCDNLSGWIGLHRDGGYAQYATLPTRNLVEIPDTLDPVMATVVPDAVSTSVHISRSRAEITPGDRAVVIGAGGGVGIHMAQVARIYGAQVAGFDIDASKLAALEQLGVAAVDSSDLQGIAPGSIWAGGRPTVVVDLVGVSATLAWALDSLAIGGRLVVLTTFRGRRLELDPRQLVLAESAVVGSRSATRAEYSLAAELVAAGDVQPVIGRVSSPREVLEIHRDLEQNRLIGRGAINWVANRTGDRPN